MAFVVDFVGVFAAAVLMASPLLGLFFALIAGLGLIVGRVEGWSRADALYWAFVTATTVGYGDMTPKHRRCRLAAVVIAILGIMFTGLVVALTVYAAGEAFAHLRLGAS